MTDEEKEKFKKSIKQLFNNRIVCDELFEMMDFCYKNLPAKYKENDYIPQYEPYEVLNLSNIVYVMLSYQVYGVAYYCCFLQEPTMNRLIFNLSSNKKHKIVSEVISQYPLVDLMLGDESHTNPLTYYPPLFACRCIINYLVSQIKFKKYSSYMDYLQNYFDETIFSMITTARAIILCLDANANDRTDAFALLRVLVETYVTFDIVSQDYKNLYLFHANRLLSKDARDKNGTELFNKAKKLFPNINLTKVSMNNDYTWAKIIGNNHQISHFDDLVDLCKLTNEEKMLIKGYYKTLCLYVHGSIKNYDSQEGDVYEITEILSFLIDKMCSAILEKCNNQIDFTFENINLLDYLKNQILKVKKDNKKAKKYIRDINSGKKQETYATPYATVSFSYNIDNTKSK